MSMSINIIAEVETDEELIQVMEHITELLKEGYTSGIQPPWEIIEV